MSSQEILRLLQEGKISIEEAKSRLAEMKKNNRESKKENGLSAGEGLPVGKIFLTPVWDIESQNGYGHVKPLTGGLVVIGGSSVAYKSIKNLYPEAQGIRIKSGDSIDQIGRKLKRTGELAHVVWIAPETRVENVEDEALVTCQEEGVIQFFRLIKALLSLGYGDKDLAWTIITRGTQVIRKGESGHPAFASIEGLIGVKAKEYPNWMIRFVDLEEGTHFPGESLFCLPEDANGEQLVHRAGQWFRQKLVQVKYPASGGTLYRKNGVYVVIGGAGGIGEVLSEYIIRKYQAKVVWIGRREKNTRIQEKIDRLSALGPAPVYITADAKDRKELEEAYKKIKALYPSIHGIVHAAIVLDDQSLARMTEEQFRRVLNSKVDVSVRIAQVFRNEALDFVLFFSSVLSFSKSAGQSNYAAGCTFKDAFAKQMALEWKCAVKIMHWGYWGSVGCVATKDYNERMTRAGIGSIEPQEAMDALEKLLYGPLDRIALVKITRQQNMSGISADTQIKLLPSSFRVKDLEKALPDREKRLEQLDALPGKELEGLYCEKICAVFYSLGWVKDRGIHPGEVMKGLKSRYSRWFGRLLSLLEEKGFLKKENTVYLCKPGGKPDSSRIEEEWARALDQHKDMPGKKALVELGEKTLGHLPEILRGQISPESLLFPDLSLDLVRDLYEKDKEAEVFAEILGETVVEYIKAWIAHDPEKRIRILEVGAGRGQASVLSKVNQFPRYIHEYCYTDVSREFLRYGQKAYQGDYPFLIFRRFNAEKPAAIQGFDEGRYDLVIASHVLCETKDPRHSLRMMKTLLRREGLLLIQEKSGPHIFHHLTLGLAEEKADPLWESLLENEGFHSLFYPVSPGERWGRQIIASFSDGVLYRKIKAVPASVTARKKQRKEEKKSVPHPETPGQRDALVKEKSVAFVKKLIADTIKIPVSRIESFQPMSTYGIDSIMVVRLNNSLRRAFGDNIDSTLLFEYRTIDDLVGYFLKNKKDVLFKALGLEEDTSVPGRESEKRRDTGGPSRPLWKSPVTSRASESRETIREEDVAVVGMSGRYAGAGNLQEYWLNLKKGKNCITEVPPERWNWKDYYNETRGVEGMSYSKWGGFIDDFDKFDPLFFKISPREAEKMDPQERLFLEEAYACMEDAGYTPENLCPSRNVGVFVGVMNGNYPSGTSYWSIANRISFLFDFTGPSLAVDTACSSSLTAIHLAVDQIQRGVIDCAIAGGVNLIITPLHYTRLSAMTVFSSDNKCKAFGNYADGFVDGEGVGALLLKPLSRAVEEGDHIYGVIKGSSLNAGGRTNGYTVPTPAAQGEVIYKAIKSAGINARSISYIEAHGTGTSLGDPIEVAGLTKAFRKFTGDKQFCAIGSAKSNIGHCEGAAGVAGVTKILLQMKYREIAPTLHTEELNPNIDFGETPFIVQRRGMAWKSDIPRIAGISSFGAGGANAHLIVEEYVPGRLPDRGSEITFDSPVIIVLSARDRDRLEVRARDLVKRIKEEALGDDSLEEMACTLQIGREAMDYRLGFTAVTIREVLGKLEAFLSSGEPGGEIFCSRVKKNNGALLLFRGDEGMQNTLENWISKRKFGNIVKLWVEGFNFDWKMLYGKSLPSRISLPTYPFARERYWIDESSGVPGTGAGGFIHPLVQKNTSNLQEQRYTSHFTGQEVYLKDHRIKGSRLLPGTALLEMARAAVLLAGGMETEKKVRVCLKHILWTAPVVVDEDSRNLHISVEPDAGALAFDIYSTGEEGNELLFCRGTSTLMEKNEDSFIDLHNLESRHWDTTWTKEECYWAFEKVGIEYGPSHRGIESIRVSRDTALARLILPPRFLEGEYFLHPGMADSALQAMLGLLDKDKRESTMVPFSVDRVELLNPCEPEMWALLEKAGKDKFNVKLCDKDGRICVNFAGIAVRVMKITGKQGLLMFKPGWKEQPLPGTGEPASGRGLVVLCEPPGGLGEQGPSSVAGVPCLVLKSSPGEDEPARRFIAYAQQMIREVQKLVLEPGEEKILVQVVNWQSGKTQFLSGVKGLLKTAALEIPRFQGQLIEIEGNLTDWEARVRENRRVPGESYIRYADGKRYVESIKELPLPDVEHPWKENGIYLITGGAGGLGRLVAKDIVARARRAKLLLTGRSLLSPEKEEWLKELNNIGGEVEYIQSDISLYEDAVSLMNHIREKYGRLTGIIHTAGVLRDNYLHKKESREAEHVLNPKVKGALNLDKALGNMELEFFVLFSSLAGFMGNMGQADYAMANSFLDYFAQMRDEEVRQKGKKGRTVSFSWPFWEEGGMALDKESEKMVSRSTGMTPLKTIDGMTALYRGLAGGESRVIVTSGHMDRIRKKFLGAPEEETVDRENLSSAGEDEELEKVKSILARNVSEILKIKRDNIDIDCELNEYGFDSITFTTFANNLNEEYDIDLTPAVFFEHSTLNSIAEYLIREYPRNLIKSPATVVRAEEEPEKVPVKRRSRQRFIGTGSAFSPGTPESVAIIGVSGMFPGAPDVDRFWENLVQEKTSIIEVPEDRWDWRAYFGDPHGEKNRTNIKWGGFIEQGVFEFDPLFFGISPREAELMDPQQRLLMMFVWKAMEDAGYAGQQLSGSRTGIFVGTGNSGYGNLIAQADLGIAGYSSTGIVPSVGPNRMSYFLNIHGPSEPVETACSSSLVAICRGVSEILQGNCGMVIAGGINTILTPDMHISFNKAGMLSEDGLCKTFSHKADGYVRGEGVGMVVLKKLDEAIKDGDHIYALIRGTAENHGGRTNSLTAPNPNAQAELLVNAYKKAGIDPETVTYIETHGTGTSLGDPIEINGLKMAFAKLYESRKSNYSYRSRCALGSVKTNIGHLELAAGIAGVIKVLMQMKHKTLVKSLHCETINPYIQLEKSPFYILQEKEEWKPLKDQTGREVPRRAGVSSFGFGGVNAHIILEEYIPGDGKESAPGVDQAHPALIVLSAKTGESLKRKAEELLSWAERRDRLDLAGAAFTLQVGRDEMEERLGFIAFSPEEMKEKLRAFIEDPEGGERLFRGRIKKNNDYLGALGSDEYIQDAQDKWVREKQYNKLLDLWVKGMSFDWRRLYQGKFPGKISLPAYPFARETYKIEASSQARVSGGIRLSPLVHENRSDFSVQRFHSSFTGEEFFLKDHRVRGKKVLPGAAYLEMVREGMKIAWGKGPEQERSLRIKEIFWLKPLFLEKAPLQISMELFPLEEGAAEFDIYIVEGQEEILHAQGTAEWAGPEKEYCLDLESLKRRSWAREMTPRECYDLFDSLEIQYGPGHQGLEAVYAGRNEVLARITLPGSLENTLEEYILHPSLLDGAFQASVGFLSPGEPARALMPCKLDEVILRGGCEKEMWAFLRHREGEPEGPIAIDLCDKKGNVRVSLSGLYVRPVKNREAAVEIISGPEAPREELAFKSTSTSEPWIPLHPGELPEGLCKVEGLDPLLSLKDEELALRHRMDQAMARVMWCELIHRGILFGREIDSAEIGPDRGLDARFRRWLEESLRILENHGFLYYDGVTYVVNEETSRDRNEAWELWAEALESCPQAGRLQYRLVEETLKSLGPILGGELPAHEVIFPGSSLSLVEGVYKNNLTADSFNRVLASVLERYLELRLGEKPGEKVRLLEIGAGTGGTTAVILKALERFKDNIEEYCYTDISKAFLIHGEKEYFRDNPFLRFTALNVELPPGEQGLLTESYDVVIGANVLHATAHMDRTMAHARALMKRNGILLLNEISSPSVFAHLTFGLLEGWWLYDDEDLRLQGSPGLTPEMWEKVLSRQGFSRVLFPASRVHDLGQQIIAAISAGEIAESLKKAPPVRVEKKILVPPAVVSSGEGLEEKSLAYIKKLVAQVLKMPANRIDPSEPLEKYGIDSLLVVDLTNSLKRFFPDIKSTLFFEHQTIGSLVDHFLATRREELARLTGHEALAVTAEVLAEEPRETSASVETRPRGRRRTKGFWRNLPERGPEEEIAFVGLSGRYGSAANMAQFWENLKTGRNCITEVPRDRWNWELYFDEEKGKPGKSYSKWGSFIDDVDKFDPLFFKISPVEAERMDPQERLFLEEAYKTIEDAGYTPGTLSSRGRVGVYVGVMNGDYPSGSSYWSIANRLSYLFNFNGPSMAVDTACSSSLTAIHLAAEALRRGQVDCAIAGGVNLILVPQHYTKLSSVSMLSPSGLCRSFGDHADGFVAGEGVGAVLMKPLSKAIEAGDHIYGVLKQSVLNSGGKTNGYTVPNPVAQGELIREALATGKVDARSVSYIEAHGTGTALGDPIEVTGLTRAFRNYTGDNGYCALGSVKSNIGHLESAAGIAGLTKVLLQLKHHQIVPSLHSGELNPQIDFSRTPFVVNRKLKEWESDGPRLAGLSSFGAGGANAHLLIGEYLPGEDEPAINAPFVILLSARDEERLTARAESLLEIVSRGEIKERELASLAYTLQVGREEMDFRLAFTAGSLKEVKEKLTSFTAGEPGDFYSARIKRDDHSLALFSSDEEMTEALDKWIQRKKFPKLLELWVKGLVFDWNRLYGERKPRRLSLPAYSFARMRCWIEDIPLSPGAAGSVKKIHPLVHENRSSFREQRFKSTFTGDEFFFTDHKVRGLKVLPGVAYLEMARAAVMNSLGISSGYGLRFRNVVWSSPVVIENQGGEVEILLTPGEEGRISYLVQSGPETRPHNSGIVELFDAAVIPALDLEELKNRSWSREFGGETCYLRFSELGIEYGPAHRGIRRLKVRGSEVLGELQLPGGLNLDGFMLNPAILDSALQGAIGLMEENRGEEAPVPFAVDEVEVFSPSTTSMWVYLTAEQAIGGQKFDLILTDSRGRICLRMKGLRVRNMIREKEAEASLPEGERILHLVPAWNLCDLKEGPAASGRNVVISGGSAALRKSITAYYPGALVLVPGKEESISSLVEKLEVQEKIEHLIWLPSPAQPQSPGAEELIKGQEEGVINLFRTVKALLKLGYGPRTLDLTLLTFRCHEVLGTDRINPLHGGIEGFAGSLAKEYPQWRVRLADLEEEKDLPLERIFRLPPGEDPLAWRDSHWYSRSLLTLKTPELPRKGYREGGVYLVIGGAGGIGEVWSEYMIRQYQAKVIWLGRRVKDNIIEEKINRLSALGEPPVYYSADAGDKGALEKAYKEIKKRYPGIHGIIHSALVLEDQGLGGMEEDRFRRSLEAKVNVSVRMAQVFEQEELDFVLFFSSMQSFTKAQGQSNYAAGCTFKDAFARFLTRYWACPVKVMNWGYWGNIGIVASPEYQERMAKIGIASIEPEEAMEALEILLRGPVNQIGLLKTERGIKVKGVAPYKGLEIVPQNPRPGQHLFIPVKLNPGEKENLEKEYALQQEIEQVLRSILWGELKEMGWFAASGEEISGKMAETGILKKYRPWLETSLTVLAEGGIITFKENIGTPVQVPPEGWAAWEKGKEEWLKTPGLKTQIILLEKLLKELPRVLKGEVPATDIMFPGSSMELVEGIYKNNRLADHFNAVLGDTLLAYIKERITTDPDARVRILELGAGTGGTSAMVFGKLKGVAGHVEEYCYTDLSKAFLMHCEKEYLPENPYITTRILDISQSPINQGFEPGQYDVVIAANVLHATANIRETLENAGSLLKGQGLLLLNELSVRTLALHLTFGLLEGWWLYEDEELRIPGSPGLYPAAWTRVLENSGFSRVGFPGEEAHHLGQQIVLGVSRGVIGRSITPVKPGTPAPVFSVMKTQPASKPVVTGPAAETAPAPQVVFSRGGELSDRMIEDHIKEVVIEKVSVALKVEINLIETDEPFSEYGVDSITGVQLVQEINNALGIELESTTLFDYTTINLLTRYIAGEYRETVSVLLRGEAPLPEEAPGEQKREIPTVEEKIETKVDIKALVQPKTLPLAGKAFVTSREIDSLESEPGVHQGAVAIIGMSARFAQSSDLEQLWENLAGGRDMVQEVTRWDLGRIHTHVRPGDKNYCNYGSFLEDIDQFDPLFFNISGMEATYMDPQQRIFLEESWKALEDAGYAGEGLEESPCGVYTGCANGDYVNLFKDEPPAQAFWGNSGSVISARVSYCLNLQGPAVGVDTACSSSLVAIHMACQGLWTREIDMALAGGVFVQSTPALYQSSERAGMLSHKGHCHAFDEKADGFVPGEGAGVVVLKRLEEALADGDHIYGVIRGSGINQDGATNGLTAPSGNSQERLERTVYDRFHINPADIQYVEAHGTGTKLGDPIEYKALTSAFNHYTNKKKFCAIGSVKSNFGHTMFAAGVAGVIKVLLCFKHKKLVPSLHYVEGNKKINFEDSPFYVNTALKEWTVPEGSRRLASISSFGFGGTNAHMVLEEPPVRTPVRGDKKGYLFVLSALSKEQLKDQARRLVAFCRECPEEELGNVSFTLLVGRKHFDHRLAWTSRNLEELIKLLEKWLTNGKALQVYTGEFNKSEHRDQPSIRRYGNQIIRDCLENQAGAQYFENLSALAELYILGYTLDYKQLFAGGNYGRISLPAYPFVRERYWVEERELAPVAGSPGRAYLHPLVQENASVLGEQRFKSTFTGDEFFLAHHVVLGMKVLPGAAYLEMARAAAAMAVEADSTKFLRLKDVIWCRPLVQDEGSLEVGIRLIAERNGEVGYEVFSRKTEEIVHSRGRVEVEELTSLPPLDLPGLLARHQRKEISAGECYPLFSRMRVNYGPGHKGLVHLFLGTGEVLGKLKMPQAVAAGAGEYVLHPGLLDSAFQGVVGLLEDFSDTRTTMPYALDEIEVFSSWSSEMWFHARDCHVPVGRKVDMDIFDSRGKLAVRIKGLAFQSLEQAPVAGKDKLRMGQNLLTPLWDPAELEGTRRTIPPSRAPLLVGGGDEVRSSFKQIYPALEILDIPGEGDDLSLFLRARGEWDHIIWCFEERIVAPGEDEEFITFQSRGIFPLFRFIKALLAAGYGEKELGWTVITRGIQSVGDGDEVCPLNSGVEGLIGSMAKEYPSWKVRFADLEPRGDWPLEEILSLPPDPRGDLLAYRNKVWYRRTLVPVEYTGISGTPYREEGVYVIIGGAGGVGAAFSGHLIRQYRARVIWLGRREPDEAIREKQKALEVDGNAPEYYSVDARDKEALTTVYKDIKKRYPQIHGVVHSAIVLQDQSLGNMDEERFSSSLSAKVDVSVRIAQVFGKENLDFLLFFSSIQSFAKAAGQSNYASGCTFKDMYARKLSLELRCRVKVMNWGYWGTVGIVASEEYLERMEKEGIGSIETEEAMECLDRLLTGPLDQIALMKTTRPLEWKGISGGEVIEINAGDSLVEMQDILGHMNS